MTTYGERTKRLPAPPHVVWADLVERRTTGTRAWLGLDADQVAPLVLDSVEPTLVVWSSLWPDRPGDRVRLELTAHGLETSLRFLLVADDDGPDEARTARIRHQVNRLLWADLRESYGG